jgi:hypothetical protein
MAKFNEYTVKATPEDADTLMLYDAASKTNKLSPFSGIWNWMVNKLTNAVINNLKTSNKTVVGALNELNSNAKNTSFKGNIKSVSFRSGGTGLKNIYIDFFQEDNSRSTLAFFTDGGNAIGFYEGDTNIWKLTVK